MADNDGRVRANLQRCSRGIRGETTRLCARINQSKRRGRRSLLTSTLSSIGHYRMDEEAMQVQGCGATPVDRDMKGSLLWLTHREVESKGSNLTRFHRDAALVLDAGRHDDRSPPLTLPEALRQRPSSPPEHGQTAGVGGLSEQQ